MEQLFCCLFIHSKIDEKCNIIDIFVPTSNALYYETYCLRLHARISPQVIELILDYEYGLIFYWKIIL